MHTSGNGGSGPDQAIAELVGNCLAQLELAEIGLPHIVVCRDEVSGLYSYSGPYRNGIDALVAAECEHRLEVSSTGADSFSFSVAVLYPVLPGSAADPAPAAPTAAPDNPRVAPLAYSAPDSDPPPS